MHFPFTFVLILCQLSRAFLAPLEAVIVQAQRWGMLGSQRFEEQVLLNGVSLTATSQEFNSIIQSISADVHLPTPNSVGQTSVLRNHTILRSRECILEGTQLQWKDRVFCDGKVCLTLDHTDTWTAHVPEAVDLKVLWDQEEQRIRAERLRLQEGCINLMRELKLTEDQSVSGIPVPQILIPLLAVLAFSGLILISLLLTKHRGLRHPGGVVGSLIHYPKDMAEMGPEQKGNGYQTL
ncbi:uncharacterized protein LOC131455442 [Solea solea]|uniref:uncharacterized protein LOC131455442 n=1 Tax=Solea solea TaxID=90069 RepID=UPI00272968BA|nr:uncharacterized protein LOC131455442 [Solea solea]